MLCYFLPVPAPEILHFPILFLPIAAKVAWEGHAFIFMFDHSCDYPGTRL